MHIRSNTMSVARAFSTIIATIVLVVSSLVILPIGQASAACSRVCKDGNVTYDYDASDTGQNPGCNIPTYTSIMFNRAWACGFFHDDHDMQSATSLAGYLIPPGWGSGQGGMGNIESAQGLIDLVQAGLFNNSYGTHGQVVSAFYVLSMIGQWPPVNGTGPSIGLAQADFNEWVSYIGGYSRYSDDPANNGANSIGPNGYIQWNKSQGSDCGDGDTYYAINAQDIGIYANFSSGASLKPPQGHPVYCNGNWASVEFDTYNNAGSANPGGAASATYIIDRDCGNVEKDANALHTPPPLQFTLAPVIQPSVNGTAGNVAEPGDTLQFTYYVNKSGPDPSSPTTSCNVYQLTQPGYVNPAPPGGSVNNAGVSCPSTFAPGSSQPQVDTWQITDAAANTSYCTAMTVSPQNGNGGTATSPETCIIVANKPYSTLSGADASVGGGIATAPSVCPENTNGTIASWNAGSGNSYAGAGTQFAAYALAALNGFSTAQGMAGGSSTPTTLTFANTAGTGTWGGELATGAACIPNYYATVTTANPTAEPQSQLTSLGSLSKGSYTATGNITTGATTIPTGDQLTLYVNGNLYIDGNITYQSPWATVQDIPKLEVIVQGNIYIAPGVTELDGIYIAQEAPDSSGALNAADDTGGTIYTCAMDDATYSTTATDPNFFYPTCDQQLTVNGAFVANNVNLMRAYGTLPDAAPNTDTTAGYEPAEVFNYNPAVWMAPSTNTGTVGSDDDITSLPPVL